MSEALRGLRVLVVEDESLVAMLLETILEDLGCIPVGPVSTVDEGVEKARSEGSLDLALLDVNVAGREVFPVADALAERGVPVVFSTGYGEAGLPDRWRGVQALQKPFSEGAVREALLKAINVARA